MTAALALVVMLGPPKAYLRALSQIAAAKTLSVDVYTTEPDKRQETRTYRYQRPNRWRLEIDGKLVDVCDGKQRWQRKGEEISRGPAPKSFETEYPHGFDRFFDRKSPLYDTFLGPSDWTVAGKKRRSYQIRTTEAGSFAGYIVVDAKTYMPIGHLYLEMGAPGPLIDEYRVVKLGAKLPVATFSLP